MLEPTNLHISVSEKIKIYIKQEPISVADTATMTPFTIVEPRSQLPRLNESKSQKPKSPNPNQPSQTHESRRGGREDQRVGSKEGRLLLLAINILQIQFVL